MKQIKTGHFVVVFPKKYESKGRQVALYAEEIHEKLSPFMQWKPFGRTMIVLSDNTDSPNGSAIPCPRNTILLYLAPAELVTSLKSQADPLYSIIVHEYTHILHLDQIRDGAWFWRVVNGRLYFPVSNSFAWYFEGVAVLSESKFAKGGRSFSHFTDALIRDAALHDAIPSFDRLMYPIVDWPGNKAAYHYGARFMEYLYAEYGKEKYDEVFINASKEFFPFIFRFAMSFKKIYGKKLDVLWNEWIDFEKNNAKSYIPEYEGDQLTSLEGEVLSFARVGDDVFISSSSYKNDRWLYRLKPDGKYEKLVNGYIRSISGTNDNNVILYTRLTSYPDDYDYFDLYSFNLKTRIEKKLTTAKRINYISFSDSGAGIMVSHSGNGSKLISVTYNKGKITDEKEFFLPENIGFVDKPSINATGTEVVFSARTDSGFFKIFRLHLSNSIIEEIQGISGTEAKFAGNNRISFISSDENTDNLFVYDVETSESFKVLDKPNCVIHQSVSGNDIYYVDETYSGEELFVKKLDLDTQIPYNFSFIDTSNDLTENINASADSSELKVKNYNFFRSLYPFIWAFLPYQMKNANVVAPVNGSYFMIPFFAPKFMIYNTTALGRFSYTASVGLDYLRYYPDNEFSFNLKLPGFDINYSWENYSGGVKYLYNGKIIDQKYNGRAPIIFSNNFNLSSSIPLSGYGNLSLQAGFSHKFQEYDFNREKLANNFIFYQQIGYYYILSRIKASRWDRGIYLNFISYQSPENLLENSPFYLIRGKIEGRVPFYNTFFFMKIEGGKELLAQNYFTSNTAMIDFSENLLGTGGATGITDIDTKAFPREFAKLSKGSAFISTDLGFDISVYKRSHYWHFATLGFKEFYIRAYNEFVYLHNNELIGEFYKGIMFDGVLELGVDLFVAYGNMTVGLVLGGALGYRLGDELPAWGVFGSVNFKLGY